MGTLIPRRYSESCSFWLKDNFKKGSGDKGPERGEANSHILCVYFKIETIKNSLMTGRKYKLGRAPTAPSTGYAHRQCSIKTGYMDGWMDGWMDG